jgi:hypothetical protein
MMEPFEKEMTEPLPLVTATFTTDELAMMNAGLIRLRILWATRSTTAAAIGNVEELERASQTIQHITEFIERIQSLVTPAQGQALLNELIKEQLKRGQQNG